VTSPRNRQQATRTPTPIPQLPLFGADHCAEHLRQIRITVAVTGRIRGFADLDLVTAGMTQRLPGG
jgi:hypothetical protein